MSYDKMDSTSLYNEFGDLRVSDYTVTNKIVGTDYGYIFHVSLRKHCDTDYSVLLWNMIGLICEDSYKTDRSDSVWGHFCDWCNTHWQANPLKPFYQIANDWVDYVESLDDPKELRLKKTYLMFSAAIKCADADTIDDLNMSAKYYLDN